MSSSSSPVLPPLLSIGVDDKSKISISFEEDWDTGIGGGLWSTGLAMAEYFTTDHAIHSLLSLLNQKRKRKNNNNASESNCSSSDNSGLSVLELGSGNGLLSIALLAVVAKNYQQQQQQQQTSTAAVINGHNTISPISTTSSPIIEQLVITDTNDHLPLICRTLDANPQIVPSYHYYNSGNNSNNNNSNENKTKQEESTDNGCYVHPQVHVTEHSWGKFFDDDDNNNTSSNSLTSTTTTFDVIIGSDVAYHADLYDILISSLRRYSNERTVILLGVTMLDTKPNFFRKLTQAGFLYTKLSDHLLSPQFRTGDRTFGIFMVTTKQ